MDKTEALKIARQSRKEATPHKLTRKSAIRAKCTECIYDPVAGGSGRLGAGADHGVRLHGLRAPRMAPAAQGRRRYRNPHRNDRPINADQAKALNAIAKEVYQNAKDHGFHDADIPEPVGNWCANLHGEVSELWEAYRKGRLFEPCAKPIPLTCAAEELADIVIRAFDTAAAMCIDIGKAVMIKSRYNQTRPHRHGGKQA